MAPHADFSDDQSNGLQILSKHDKDLIWEWNHVLPVPVEDLVQDLIAKNVRSYPNAPAICAWDAELDYQELDTLSSRLSAVLEAQGVTKDVIVPLCFEKSAWTVVAILAVIKAGGTFVLLDAGQPEGRLREILNQTKSTLILCSLLQQAMASRLASNVIAISAENLRQLPDKIAIQANASCDDTLFIVFTSGSTGLPKGVMSSHRSFVSGVHHRRSILEMPSPRVFDFAAYSFDVSTDIILSTLIIGGCVCVPSNEERQNDIAGAMRRLKVNSADLTPSVARLIKPELVPSLQMLKLGGELSTTSDVNMWAQKTKLVNIYGPSECLVVATNDLATGTDPRTIGRGRGAVTWIVATDDHHSLVPIGAIGELVVEGPIITKGYLHDQKRTAESFIESPYWLVAGGGGYTGRQSRLYKTGDLVYYNSDGSINFVGRKDTQVKIRGQRVELNEVEHHVEEQLFEKTGLRLSPIADLITPNVNHGRPTLMAFLGMRHLLEGHGHNKMPDNQTVYEFLWAATKDINKSLLKLMPQYMVPTVYVPMWTVPLNNSGKTDRRQIRKLGEALTRKDITALRGPAKSVPNSQSKSSFTAIEIQVRALWGKVLKMDSSDIKKTDHFVSLGGDSLHIMKLAAMAGEEDIDLSVIEIFAHPVLAEMAKFVEAKKATPRPHF
ncbi:Nonribosomal peptide synthetase 4-like protein 2 [Phlyctema vagabunda]|uniref:Nonribosomal peptide synthetase 4-like protein 2 n=1 Tax=Phlyctema vagabunda TaxID=108571 RepID=A0ABR4PD17_9HELO